METQLETQNAIPKELGDVETADANSFTEALEILDSNETGKAGLWFKGPIIFNEKEENSLQLLPKAFDLNTKMQMLLFSEVEVDHILVAQGLKTGITKDKVTFISFRDCKKVSDQRLLESMCEGFKERSTAFQLVLYDCSSEFVKPIIEASCERCFSLDILDLYCAQIQQGMKEFFLKGRLYYITLGRVKGLKEDVFLQLGRCLLPNVIKLNLFGTNVPPSALKRLHGFLKKIFDSGRSNLFEKLHLGNTILGNKLSFAYIRLLRSDVVGEFSLKVKEDISRAVVRNISATVANTKNLTYLNTGRRFSSGTKFKNFNLQEGRNVEFNSPFGVNTSVALDK